MTNQPRDARLDPQKVVAARLALGLRQADLAQRARMSKQMMCDIEAGRRNGSPVTHKLLAGALGLRRIADLYVSDR